MKQDPKVGDQLDYYAFDGKGPYAATVAFVHSPSTVAIAFLSHLGQWQAEGSVMLLLEGEGVVKGTACACFRGETPKVIDLDTE